MDVVNNKHQDANIDAIVEQAVFGADDRVRSEHQRLIREMAPDRGAFPASIQGLYEAAGRGLYQNTWAKVKTNGG